ncbi:MAG: hypothetical protein H6709_17965 [Kofleriaceae bacterium]|nr:hypothetical protein [Myxococcales bacterium]MCB9559710.1 hypothetical protein [Kofleriaceae bacterium]MCB9573971.1 hypothetical protein [Kofleriaceae bacterium]
MSDIVAAASIALRDAARHDGLALEDVARFCAEVGGVDPRLEQAALRHAVCLCDVDALITDLIASLRARLIAAGPLLPTLVARGGVPRVLASLGVEDVEPVAGALTRPVPPRIARFYWQRLRAYLAWSAACAWS